MRSITILCHLMLFVDVGSVEARDFPRASCKGTNGHDHNVLTDTEIRRVFRIIETTRHAQQEIGWRLFCRSMPSGG
jgi:hypothetical protein